MNVGSGTEKKKDEVQSPEDVGTSSCIPPQVSAFHWKEVTSSRALHLSQPYRPGKLNIRTVARSHPIRQGPSRRCKQGNWAGSAQPLASYRTAMKQTFCYYDPDDTWRPHGILNHVPHGSMGPVLAASLFWKFVACVAQFPLPSKKATYGGEGSNLFYTLRLDDLVDRRVFGRILSREDAKASRIRDIMSPSARHTVEIHHDRAWRMPRSFWKAGRWHYRYFPHIGLPTPGIDGLLFESERPRRTRCGLGMGTMTGGIGRPGGRAFDDHVCKDAVEKVAVLFKLNISHVIPIHVWLGTITRRKEPHNEVICQLSAYRVLIPVSETVHNGSNQADHKAVLLICVGRKICKGPGCA
ncbi:hypothetical protein BGW80DRAFT_1257098 [Lactifluus volemus]|nr:hypothetical protein BGW80DRAFT_1257098 [Lactifluus volemus]